MAPHGNRGKVEIDEWKNVVNRSSSESTAHVGTTGLGF